MNKFVIFAIIAIPALAVSFLVSDPFAVAKPQSKVHFTKTFVSSTDPGSGNGQFALVLAPNRDSIYTGSLTFTANNPVEILVLHQIPSQDSRGQPTWSVDGNTIYGLTEIEAKKAGTFDFTGSAVAFRSSSPFVVTTSVDGWIRGQPVELISQTYEIKEQEIELLDQNIPVVIPMRDGFYGKGPVNYIITDSSNKTISDKLAQKHGWNVKFAPKLRWAPASAQDTIYAFTNGIKGDGIYGFQGEVFGVTPAHKEYTPLASLVTVSWKAGQKPQELQSAEDILKAEKDSRLRLTKTNVTVNVPQIIWPGGQIQTTNSTVLDNAQVLEINKDSKKVTFVAHRAWGPDGRITYYIIPDATPKGPADIMKVPVSGKLAKVATSNAISEMYQFKNGVKGAGPLGFQPSVLSSALDERYVPICRISIVEWKDAKSAIPLQTISDIESKKSDGSVFVTLARPQSEDHVVNCPIIESPKSNKG
ncbi:DUF7482 domain-containing protein [Candidatus Nitrosotenuis aquarius]|uniref:DUF7482 domain-containing protein n=1 Tax=Candidatus Nitrosotenuis aquarius TaxID=1846278 RepID=UPI000C1F4BD8|nr:hypothetical protein [Candidatus Nitrosotenuis aquarius]